MVEPESPKSKSHADQESDNEHEPEEFRCRFYRKDFPDEHDLVVVRPRNFLTWLAD